MKHEPGWPVRARRRYCPDCYRLAHDGDCEQLAIPGWRATDIPGRNPAPRKAVTVARVRGGLL